MNFIAPKVPGHDISEWQGAVNFARFGASGAKFVIMRCSYGKLQDAWYRNYYDGFAGILPRGCYHFYNPYYSPRQQYDVILSQIETRPPDTMRVWIDMEHDWSGTYESPRYWAELRDLLRARGYKTGIYTSRTWWDGHIGGYSNLFAGDALWVAQYYSSLTRIPAGFAAPMIWQDSVPAAGAQVGVSSTNIDHNWWNNDYNFADEWRVSSPPPTTGGKMYGKINTAALNIRSGPGTTFPIIGGLQLGDIVTASEIVNGWWHITDAERGGVNVKLTSGATVEGSPACWAGGTYILPIDAPPAPAQDSVTIVINQGGVVKTYKITGTIQLS